MRRAKTFSDRLHVGDCRWRCTEAKTTMTRSQHCRIVVFAHHAPGNEDGIQRHEDGLYHQNRQHRQRQRSQLPQFQPHQRHRQEQRQAYVTQHGYRTLKDAVKAHH